MGCIGSLPNTVLFFCRFVKRMRIAEGNIFRCLMLNCFLTISLNLLYICYFLTQQDALLLRSVTAGIPVALLLYHYLIVWSVRQ